MITPEQERLNKTVERDRAWQALEEARALREAFPFDPTYLQRLLDAQTRYYRS